MRERGTHGLGQLLRVTRERFVQKLCAMVEFGKVFHECIHLPWRSDDLEAPAI